MLGRIVKFLRENKTLSAVVAVLGFLWQYLCVPLWTAESKVWEAKNRLDAKRKASAADLAEQYREVAPDLTRLRELCKQHGRATSPDKASDCKGDEMMKFAVWFGTEKRKRKRKGDAYKPPRGLPDVNEIDSLRKPLFYVFQDMYHLCIERIEYDLYASKRNTLFGALFGWPHEDFVLRPEDVHHPNRGEREDFAIFHMLLWESSKMARRFSMASGDKTKVEALKVDQGARDKLFSEDKITVEHEYFGKVTPDSMGRLLAELQQEKRKELQNRLLQAYDLPRGETPTPQEPTA